MDTWVVRASDNSLQIVRTVGFKPEGAIDIVDPPLDGLGVEGSDIDLDGSGRPFINTTRRNARLAQEASQEAAREASEAAREALRISRQSRLVVADPAAANSVAALRVIVEDILEELKDIRGI